MLKGPERPYFAERVTIPFDGRARFIYFLHAVSWSYGRVLTKLVTLAGKIVLQYTDRTQCTIPVLNSKDVVEWMWNLGEFENARLAWVGRKGRIFVSKFENPFPDKPIKSITLLHGDCVWGVIALTCCMHEIPIRGVKEILLEPKVFSLPELKEAESPSVPLEAPQRKSVFVCRLPNGAVKTISLHNCHVIGIDGERFVDVSDITDVHKQRMRPLGKRDLPGSITFSVDSGPEYDWRRDIWIMPDEGIYLVNNTDEFWDWNAVRFTVPAGEHILRVRFHSPFVKLDGVVVYTSLEDKVDVRIVPTPRRHRFGLPVFYKGQASFSNCDS